MADEPLRVMTYNIHDGVGRDGLRDLGRIAEVIAEVDPDVAVLQEVSGPGDRDGPEDGFRALAEATGLIPVESPALIEAHRRYGNLILSRWPVRTWEVVDLAYPEREARNAVFTKIETSQGPLRVIGTHFGLVHRERMAQARLIADLAAQHRDGPLVVAGDFNDWPPFSRAVSLVRREMGLGFGAVPRLPTFPNAFPLLALDRIFVRPRGLVRRTWVHRSPLSHRASDHRPLVAEIDLVS